MITLRMRMVASNRWLLSELVGGTGSMMAVRGRPQKQHGRRKAPAGRRIPTGITYSSLPIATAVSAMRLEKPHSLSYQATMRTNVPPRTLVWSMPNVAECGSWLRSDETSGSLVQVTMFASRFDLAAFVIALLTSSTVVDFLATNPRSMKETFGVGT